MYNVLLVDDEPAVTNSLKSWIPWENFNMEISGIASSAEEALELLQLSNIHIVLTDIRMQGMGGLELCQIIHSKYSDIQTIIMSGYAEFSYAQRAFKYDILGYCLKPLEYDEICMYLNRALKKLQAKEDILSIDDFLDAISDENTEDISRFLKASNLAVQYFYLMISSGNKQLPIQQGITFPVGRRQYAYMSPLLIPTDDIQKFINENSDVCIGKLSEPVSAFQLPEKFRECQTLARQSFINPACQICDTIDTKHASALLKEISSFLSPNKLISMLETVKLDTTIKHSFSVKSALQLCNSVLSVNSYLADQEHLYNYSIEELLTRYKHFDHLLDTLIHALSDVSLPDISVDRLSNQNFLKIMNYITTHYHEDIALTDIADLLHMSPNYLSQVFKKETGTTFSKYLTDLRITKARQLLKQKTLSISEVSIKVGFNDYFYFLKTFKKVTGKTPSQYRSV